MKHPSSALKRGHRLQSVLNWLQSSWPPADGDWRPTEAVMHRFISAELGEHLLHPTQSEAGLILQAVGGSSIPSQMDKLYAELRLLVLAALGGKQWEFQLDPYSVTYKVVGAISGGIVRYGTIPCGTLRDLTIAAFLHYLQEQEEQCLFTCPECTNVFVRTGRRLFCSDRCASRATSRAYRQKHPEKHRRSAALADRKRYQKQITQDGKLKIKIAVRKRKY